MQTVNEKSHKENRMFEFETGQENLEGLITL